MSEDLAKEIERMETKIKQCLLDISTFNEADTMARLSKSKSNSKKQGRPVTEETAERITKLRSELHRLEKNEKIIVRDKGIAVERIKDVEKKNAKVKEEYAHVVEVTTGSYDDIFGLENEANRVKHVITKLKEEQDDMKKNLATKNDRLEELIQTLTEFNHLEEMHLEVTTGLSVVEQQLFEETEEENTLKRLEKSKLLLLENASKDNVRDSVRIMEGDKKSLYSRIQNRRKQKEVNQRCILTQGYEISQLEKQLRFFSLALKEVGITLKPDRPGINPDDDLTAPLHISLLNEAITLVLGQRKSLGKKESMLDKRDAQIESLEERVYILSCVSKTTQVQTQYAAKQQAEEYAHMQSLMEQRQEMFEEATDKLKQQQDQLRKKLEKNKKEKPY